MQDITKSIRRTALSHVLIQFVAVIAVSTFGGLFAGVQVAFSILLGGLACVLPNLYFAKRFCLSTQASNPKNLLLDLYKAETMKLFLTAAIFLLIFKLIPVTISPAFVGIISAQAAFWVSVLILSSNKAVNKL